MIHNPFASAALPRPLRFALLAVLVAASGCDRFRPVGEAARPLPDSERLSLGSHTHPISTSNPEAQKAFDRGLVLAYGFDHREAEKEFLRAAGLDPSCAMAWWGVALVNGPHINYPMVPSNRAERAWLALSRARTLVPRASPEERQLIEALGARYAQDQPEDRSPLDQAYADAMRKVHLAYPNDPDAATLFAEALMDLRPWDLWTNDGKPQPGTGEIVETLEKVLAADPDNPGANHFYIHAMDASSWPQKALPSADRLRTLVPGASHLLHMPAHIYARVGRWSDAATANIRAMAVDTLYRSAHPDPGFYALYMAHNAHFYGYVAMMQGRKAEALKAARAMVDGIPPDFLEAFGPVADGYMAFPLEVLLRFGAWEAVLAEPEPPESLPLCRALWRYARTESLSALGRGEDATRERVRFSEAAAKVPEGWMYGNNPASNVLAVAGAVLDGVIASNSGDIGGAIPCLRDAVRLEDALRYDEPPAWIQPVRHTLGAVFMRAGRYGDAEKTYREDLARHPENGWSLFGLTRALKRQDKTEEAAAAEARFHKAWIQSDFPITATCCCQPGV